MVECQIFSEGKIFSSENIFKKGKYFQVFGCVAKNALENPFLSCFSHFLRIQTNTITKIKTKKKKFKITRPIEARSVRGFVGEDEGWVDRFVGSWRDLAGGRGGSISSWVRGVISPSHGGDEDVDQFVGS